MTASHPRAGRANATKVLFLQGPPSAFARRLGEALRAGGAEVLRINLCFGDWLFWHGPGTRCYRGSLARWPEALARLLAEEEITHLLYFGDRIPYHAAAREVAERQGVAVLAYEYGYLRPDWIVAEPGGQGAYSTLTTDPARLKAAARALPEPDLARRHAFAGAVESAGDVAYHLGNALTWPLFPGFRADRRHNAVLEYLSYLPRIWRARRGVRRGAALLSRLRAEGRPFFLVALQMQGDYQIRANSPYRDQRQFLAEVLASFAAKAPAEAALVVKLHPHDNGLTPWRHDLARKARALGLAGRVHLLDGGTLEDWAGAARGLVTVNSTSGLMALTRGCPVLARGIAIYDLPGVTHQSGLDRFWTAAEAPEADALSDLLRVLAGHLHVRGDFYGASGVAAGVDALAARILTPGPDAGIFDAVPPRLARARAMGVPIHGWA